LGWHLLSGALIFCLCLAPFEQSAPLPGAGVHLHRHPTDFKVIMSRMNDAAHRFKTLSANLEYTTVTVLVNDHSTEYGQIYFRKAKRPEVLIKFVKPDPKVILFRRNRAEVYLPKINTIQEYEVGKKSALLQQFLLLGFGTDVTELQKSYTVKYLREEQLGNETAAVLELMPSDPKVAAQLVKVQLWVSEDSWLPAQQKFFEPSGDYLVARYRGIEVNRGLSSSIFHIEAPGNAKRVPMN
jgi:outer membrane lipoprotein-sorting protein